MIRLERVTKSYPSYLGPQTIFEGLTFDIPTDKNIAILGKNGAGKSTLFRLLANSEYPDEGKILCDKRLSWPIALATGLHPKMTGRQNARFIGRVNGVRDLDQFEKKVLEFSELGEKFELFVQDYSNGMRTRLSFSCVLGIDFDCYLIDEATSVADPSFRKKARQAIIEKSKSSNIIMVSHKLDELREFCDSALLVFQGKLIYFKDLEEGIRYYESL